MNAIIYRVVSILWAVSAVLYAIEGDRAAFLTASALLAAWTFLAEFSER